MTEHKTDVWLGLEPWLSAEKRVANTKLADALKEWTYQEKEQKKLYTAPDNIGVIIKNSGITLDQALQERAEALKNKLEYVTPAHLQREFDKLGINVKNRYKKNKDAPSNRDNWETPQALFDKLDEILDFDIDVCATVESSKCRNCFTPDIDGLSQPWTMSHITRAFCNPPFSQKDKWVRKAVQEAKNNVTTCMILPVGVNTKLWQELVFPNTYCILFPKKRINYVVDGKEVKGCNFETAVVIFGWLIEEECCGLMSLGYLVSECQI